MWLDNLATYPTGKIYQKVEQPKYYEGGRRRSKIHNFDERIFYPLYKKNDCAVQIYLLKV